MPNRKKLLEGFASWNAPVAAGAVAPSLVPTPTRPATSRTDYRDHRTAPSQFLSASQSARGPPVPVTAEYITARQLCDRWGGISFTTLDRYIKSDEDMPRPVYFGARNRFFKVSAIVAYEHKCEVRDAARALLAAEANND